ncbi:hypothetical protein [Actinoplanes subglobosus]|uniref:Anti-sigma factor n=1 Tax=Actinoplanes subglobosus TaxID=1547892 RepID=A0ABV8ISP0_9ACTN
MTGAEFEGVDFDLLADYVGGALDGTPDEERVASLVATDETWRAAYEALEPGVIAVGAVLRELEPEPMPDDLAARLDAMFRVPVSTDTLVSAPADSTAAAVPDTSPTESAEPVPAKVVDLDKARRRRRWAAPIAVAAGAVAFAALGVNSFLTSDAAEDTAAGSGLSEAAPMADRPVSGEMARSGIDYTESTLAQAAAGQMRTAAGSVDSPQVAGQADLYQAGRLDRLSAPDALAACVQEITRENGGGVLAVEFTDYARFEGNPALIVRFSAANGTWVWAVGPECGTPGAGADELKRLPVR